MSSLFSHSLLESHTKKIRRQHDSDAIFKDGPDVLMRNPSRNVFPCVTRVDAQHLSLFSKKKKNLFLIFSVRQVTGVYMQPIRIHTL